MAVLRRVTAFVDWDTARRCVPPSLRRRPTIEDVFTRLQDSIASYIKSRNEDGAYRVGWRIYHGWHQGKTKTPDRLAFESFTRNAKARTLRSISFSADFAYGNDLCCASVRNPLYDTLRRDPDTGKIRQKMVDTALACDLLHLARSRDSHLYVVIGDDDDLLPAIITAESWRVNAVLLHNRADMNASLNLRGITSRMESVHDLS